MARADTSGRLRRLEMLAVQLKQDSHCTVSDLARQHGVSPRTIARDLALMRDHHGMQIDADRGRGGGLRLDRNWGVGRLNLTYGDAVDLLISIAVAQILGPLLGGMLIDALGYRSIFPAAAMLMIVGLAILQFVRPRAGSG